MKTFTCLCGNTLNFQNSVCVNCNASLGFLPDTLKVSSIYPAKNDCFHDSSNKKLYRKCKNYTVHNVCNWMIPADDPNELCASCRLNVVIPNLEKPENNKLWFRMEQAKRRLLYTLFKLNLPVVDRNTDPKKGLGFSFLENQIEDEYGNELTIKEYVVTGHSSGLITLNLNEAEPSARIEMREQMNEQYRTLIGHFRHESGHYYWDLLVKDTPLLEEFRELFGDERLNYTFALNEYYRNGPNLNWQDIWISAYASMHPWEDWAETWAHYLHMVDTLETAHNYQLSISNQQVENPLVKYDHVDTTYTAISFTQLFDDWCRLTKAINAINRSMGHDDAYPFVISISALNKLRFVHNVIKNAAF
ncbi:zinc-binding metallopeptidase family protein [Bermanella sp. WJH001]|uniref:zinc-binding metallopeptidase family protein n=1 Tax=Bermanella sp. WJH001 TaxID=3048005 RepID=UPI0024BDEA6E|nr:putative zinc-binding metallopeptidase [Bermanella sp. WJH001]MDJ1536846.1 putative zinc-binding metallopeptidase [Bermanella sp. WJH001]